MVNKINKLENESMKILLKRNIDYWIKGKKDADLPSVQEEILTERYIYALCKKNPREISKILSKNNFENARLFFGNEFIPINEYGERMHSLYKSNTDDPIDSSQFGVIESYKYYWKKFKKIKTQKGQLKYLFNRYAYHENHPL